MWENFKGGFGLGLGVIVAVFVFKLAAILLLGGAI